jgi:hypothetical protein
VMLMPELPRPFKTGVHREVYRHKLCKNSWLVMTDTFSATTAATICVPSTAPLAADKVFVRVYRDPFERLETATANENV